MILVVTCGALNPQLDLDGCVKVCETWSFLCQHGIPIAPTCHQCGAEESSDHLVLLCALSKEAWSCVGIELNPHFPLTVFKDWLPILSGRGSDTPMLQKIVKSILLFASWEN